MSLTGLPYSFTDKLSGSSFVLFQMTEDRIKLYSSHIPNLQEEERIGVKWGFKYQLDETGYIWSQRSPALKIKSPSHCLIHTLSHPEGEDAPSEEAIEVLQRVSLLTRVPYPLFSE